MGLLNNSFVPSLSLAMVDPPVYPYFDIYPAAAGGSSPRQPREKQRLTSSSGRIRVASVSVKLEAAYPQFDICEFVLLQPLFRSMKSKPDHVILFGPSAFCSRQILLCTRISIFIPPSEGL